MASKFRRNQTHEEDEGYFMSMTDMMVGLLFIFLILLVYFAMQMKQTTEDLAGADNTRTKFLEQLEQSLKDQGIKVNIDTEHGVLRLPEDVLFASGDYNLSPKGMAAIAIVSKELAKTLPCYTYPKATQNCPKTKHIIDAVFIEGHTDTDRFSGNANIADNLDLSTKRATNTYRQIVSFEPSLLNMCNSPEKNCQKVLSVSAYGEYRPIDYANTPEAKAKNRRIDIRFLMVTPKTDEISITKLRGGL